MRAGIHIIQGRRLALVAAALVAAALLCACTTPTIEITNPDFARLSDGSWEGSWTGSMGSATTVVLVREGKVASVALSSFNSSPIGKPAKAIADRIVVAQSLDVDVVSGASYSSRVILRAVQDALSKAVRP